MENRLEAEAESSDLHGVIDLDTVVQHSDASPVIRRELGVVVGEQGWTLVALRLAGFVQPLDAVRGFVEEELDFRRPCILRILNQLLQTEKQLTER